MTKLTVDNKIKLKCIGYDSNGLYIQLLNGPVIKKQDYNKFINNKLSTPWMLRYKHKQELKDHLGETAFAIDLVTPVKLINWVNANNISV